MTAPPDPAAAAGPAPARGGPQRIPVPPGGATPGGPAPWAELSESLRRPSLASVRHALAEVGPAVASPVELGGFAAAASIPASVRRAMAVPDDRPPIPSAVLAPLYERDGEAWVVLTRRGLDMRAHAGEVSFPGGRVEADDRDLVHTALRESEEEIGLDPGAVEIIGELDHLATISSGSFIVPWVGALGAPPDLRPTSVEVDGIIHVALSELMAPGVFREQRWDLGGAVRPIVFFDLFGDTVWGATAAMLRQLLGLVTGTVARGELGHD